MPEGNKKSLVKIGKVKKSLLTSLINFIYSTFLENSFWILKLGIMFVVLSLHSSSNIE